jgi:hypothetical protein
MEEKWLGGGGLKRKRSFATAVAMACQRRGKRLDGELRLGFEREAGVLHDADEAGGAQGRGVASWPCMHARDAAWPSGPAASRGRVPGRDVRRLVCAEPPRRAHGLGRQARSVRTLDQRVRVMWLAHEGHTCARWARQQRRRRLFKFHVHTLEIAKLPKCQLSQKSPNIEVVEE